MVAMLTAGVVALAVAPNYQFHTDGSTGG
jgi:hypothetical protein